MTMNLVSGQYQIGSLVFGRGTNISVDSFDIKPYDINAQDHQVSRNDEMRFGMDQFKPTTIEITMHILNNKLLHPYESLIPNFWKDRPTVFDLHREWRGDDVRQIWGEMKPLYFCGKDGITRAIYGRPGQFTYAKDSDRTDAVQVLAQFRCGDTLAYTAQEAVVSLNSGTQYLTRQTGNADSWLRLIYTGGATNPAFTIGSNHFTLNGVTIASNDILEISSYPWSRRIVSGAGINYSANLGSGFYLDKLRIPAGVSTAISATGGSCMLLWRDGWSSIT